MKLLEERIKKEGRVYPGGILKVDMFLNHQLDPKLMHSMAEEVQRLYSGTEITKIITVEASGIAFAIMVGYLMDVPVVFAKKHKSKNISDSVYSAEVPSYTHGNINTIVVSKEYLHSSDRVLLIDDFLATGAALVGMRSLVRQAGAECVGAAVAIEKVFQQGGNILRADGMRVESLAAVTAMSDDEVSFD